MEDKLKSVCQNCTKPTIQVYMRNIKRLYKLHPDNKEEVPADGKWLANKTLHKKLKALPLNQRRHLSVAGLKACRATKKDDTFWLKQMKDDSDKYSEERGKRTLTDKEKERIPKKGYAAIKKLAAEYAKRTKKAWATKSNTGLYKYSIYIALKLMSEVPLRNTAATLQIAEQKAGNFIDIPKKGNAKLVIREHKSAKKLGTKEIPLSRAVTNAIRKFIRYRKDQPHDFLLSNKQGEKLTKSALGKALHRVTNDILGKSFGSRIIRIMAAQKHSAALEKADALANAMLHANKTQTLQYAKK
jgi:hypothetical protein